MVCMYACIYVCIYFCSNQCCTSTLKSFLIMRPDLTSGGGLNLSEGGGTIRKSIIKNSTPWNRAGAGTGAGDSSGGTNRAARRAALKK